MLVANHPANSGNFSFTIKAIGLDYERQVNEISINY